MTRTTECYAEVGTGVTICYDSFGDPSDPTMLLVMGLGAQMVSWEDGFCQQIADQGFHVVRFDNRDAGLSTFLPEPVEVFEVIQQIGAGETPDVPYLLSDMAADTIGLLDRLGVDRAHIVGASLGGMIAQTVALEHPERVLTLTSVMSTTGDPDVGQPTSEALGVLLTPPPQTREQMQDRRVASAHAFGSPGLWDEVAVRERAGEHWDRKHDATGVARQLAAILASGSRSERLRHLDVPTLVIHGTADNLVGPSGGERTAEVVPNAKLLLIEGMGHDLPAVLWPQIVEAITAHAAQHPPGE
jgi:pimeloyl-ACP methyl ester carboxylesterase